MTTGWQISSDSARVVLDANGKAEAVFTVGNPGPDTEHVTFEVVPAEGAAPGWFEVEDPQRKLLAGWSAAYTVRLAVPPSSRTGAYSFQGRAMAKGRELVRSERVVFGTKEHAGEAPPGSGSGSGSGSGDGGTARPKRNLPWKILAPVGVVALLLLGLVGWLLFRDTSVEVPNLVGKTREQARATLTELGLRVGTVRARQDLDSEAGEIRAQYVKPGTKVKAESRIGFEVAQHLDSPVPVLPARNARIDGRTFPHLEWKPVAGANGYRVRVEFEWCVPRIVGKASCSWTADSVDIEGTTSARPALKPQKGESLYSGKVRWLVSALDEFGDPGPPSEPFTFFRPASR